VINDLGGIGMHPEAKEGIDPFDAVALPRILNYADLSSAHPEFFQPRFMRDVIPAADQHSWKLAATSNADSRSAELIWDNSSWSGAAHVLLYDEAEGIMVNMKSTNQYRFNLGASRGFQFFYSKNGDVSPDVTNFGRPFPNPSAADIIFPCLIAPDDEVQINVYDLTGRLVQTLVPQQDQSGYKQVLWDGTNRQGGRVKAGIYLYRFTSKTGKTNSGKITLH
jgi:hypothetical protein